jgi:hypothetical protein
MRSSSKLFRIRKRSSSRLRTSSLNADFPSIFTRGSRFRTSKIVGRMSIVSTQASFTLARVCPGALMSSGIGAISAAVSRPRRRRSRACGNATPWSAATTISASSQRPSLRSLCQVRWSIRSAKPVCRTCRWSSTSSWPWSSKACCEMPGIASFGARR